MPSPDAPAPTRFCVQGWEAVLVGQAQGLNSLGDEPLSRDRTPTEAAPRTASLFLLRLPARSRWPDGSGAASPLNCC